jgi:hypothetical protein
MRPPPHPKTYRGSVTCSECGCTWKLDDLSAPNPVDDWCSEPLSWHPNRCSCHSSVYAMAYLNLPQVAA